MPPVNFLPSLPFIAETLCLQPVFQVAEQVIVAWSENRAVSSLVKQLPVEMLQQLYAYAHCHIGALLHMMSGFHAFCSEWRYTVVLMFHNAKHG
jgi:hypothetical protein